jgi:hypothetical protein
VLSAFRGNAWDGKGVLIAANGDALFISIGGLEGRPRYRPMWEQQEMKPRETASRGRNPDPRTSASGEES